MQPRSRFHRSLFPTILLPLLSAIGLSLALVGWGLSSPVGSSPDEDFHLISIWCENGGYQALCEIEQDGNQRLVNSGFVAVACFAGKPEVSGTCQQAESVFSRDTLELTNRGNFGGQYPVIFYKVMRLLASPDVQTSVVGMRIANSFLFAAVISVIFSLLPRYLRPTLFFAVALTIVPLGLSLIPSINPSSWTITGVIASFFGAIGFMRSQAPARYGLAGVAVFGVLLAAGARTDGAIYAVIALLAGLVVSAYKIHLTKRFVLFVSGGVIVAMGAFFALGGINLLRSLVAFAGSSPENSSLGSLILFARNLANLPLLWAGFSGGMGLSWFDTKMPYSVWLIAGALLWAVIFMRLGLIQRRTLWVSLSSFALLALIPLVVLQVNTATVGMNVQPRYIYPILILLTATVLFREAPDKMYFSKSQSWVLFSGLLLAQSLALYVYASRFISGADPNGGSASLDAAASTGWWWSVGPGPMLVWGISSFGFAIFLLLIFTYWRSKPPVPSSSSVIQVGTGHG